MGQRRSKTIVGLLLLVTIIASFFIYNNSSQFQQQLMEERAGIIGKLAGQKTTSEAEIMQAFNGEKTNSNIQAGQRLDQKYGFYNRTTRQGLFLRHFLIENSVILASYFCCVMVLVLWLLLEKRKIRIFLEESKSLQETEAAQHAVLLERKEREEGAIKSSITDIAHQLKTPVASMKLSMEIALSEGYSLAERQEFREQAEVQLRKFDLMLDGLAKISRLEQDLISLQPSSHKISEIINEAINSVILKALEKEIEIELTMEKERDVLVDDQWTIEAIGNILENAIKYSPEKTTVNIHVTSLVTYAVIEIVDEGPGIEKAELAKIYHRFYRGKTSQGIEGSGVGLYLTRKIIEGQGGIVKVKTQQPKGAKFQLTLPLA